LQKIKNRKSFLLTLVCIIFANCSAQEAESTKNSTENKNSSEPTKLTVYYFHTEYRCWSCNQFETLTKEVIEESFKHQLENGIIEFKSVNIETDAHKHFVEDYRLVTKSVVLALSDKDGQVEWKNMDKIWTLVRNTEKFKSYMKEGVTSYMNRIQKS